MLVEATLEHMRLNTALHVVFLETFAQIFLRESLFVSYVVLDGCQSRVHLSCRVMTNCVMTLNVLDDIRLDGT